MTGSGTLADPYVIWDVNDLQNINLNLTAYYELGQDIDAAATVGWNGGLGFDPVGNYSALNPDWAFRGNFDGKGCKITELFINRPLEEDVALFGYTGLVGGYGGDARVIQNVGLEDCNITGGDYAVAGLIGFNDHARAITNCWVTGFITATSDPTYISLCAGLVGYTDWDVTDCYFSGTITLDDTANGSRARQNGGLIGLLGGGTAGVTRCYSTGKLIFNGRPGFSSRCWEAGGFLGMNTGAPISQCYSTMNITLNDCERAVEEFWAVGGFVGDSGLGAITNCYARGSINAVGLFGSGDSIGGFAGWNNQTLTNCYSTGLVTTNAVAHIGGFCGWNDGGTITDCFWDTETSGTLISDGGTGMTTAQMKDSATFISAGWGFGTIWGMTDVCNNGYPCLLSVTPGCAWVVIPTVTTNPATRVI